MAYTKATKITQKMPSGCENPEEFLVVEKPKWHNFLVQFLMLASIFFLAIPKLNLLHTFPVIFSAFLCSGNVYFLIRLLSFGNDWLVLDEGKNYLYAKRNPRISSKPGVNSFFLLVLLRQTVHARAVHQEVAGDGPGGGGRGALRPAAILVALGPAVFVLDGVPGC